MFAKAVYGQDWILYQLVSVQIEYLLRISWR
jgi:hypothetical protein